ncbi:MAG: cytidine deaminase [Candidatus Cloacimonetes bacterium]|nr:cytidine deaminase [Candidatus Cloacimonadota bacterium]
MDVIQTLLRAAQKAAQEAYAPYSGYKVGSAIMTTEGRIFTGCNVENASYSLTLCAERLAIFKAVSEGYQKFTGIAIYAETDKPFPPCGACRQVLAEFSPDLQIIYANQKGQQITTLTELLPHSFTLDS